GAWEGSGWGRTDLVCMISSTVSRLPRSARIGARAGMFGDAQARGDQCGSALLCHPACRIEPFGAVQPGQGFEALPVLGQLHRLGDVGDVELLRPLALVRIEAAKLIEGRNHA